MTWRITQLGEPVLRKVAKPVKKLRRQELHTLIREMLKAMRKAHGVGIAAPQVGKSLRVFIVAPQPSKRYPHSPQLKPISMINPQLVSHSKATNKQYEGCLSVPGIRGEVPRYNEVRIRFYTPEGTLKEAILKGFVARIFQHEFDHINGQVFLDRVTDTRTLMTEQQYRKGLQPRS